MNHFIIFFFQMISLDWIFKIHIDACHRSI